MHNPNSRESGCHAASADGYEDWKDPARAVWSEKESNTESSQALDSKEGDEYFSLVKVFQQAENEEWRWDVCHRNH